MMSCGMLWCHIHVDGSVEHTLFLGGWVRLACMLPRLVYPHLHLCPAAVQQPPCAPVHWHHRGMYSLPVC